MTVPAAVTTYRYEGNGVTTVFAYSNRLLTTADVKVQILTRATDAIVETLALTTDYTVTLVSNSLANITITNATKIPSVTQDILLTLDLAISQTRSYPRADSLPAADIEKGLDKLTLIAQKQDDKQTLTLRFPDSDTNTDGELPPKAERALTYLAFDADGVPIASASAAGGAPAGAFGATLVATATQLEAQTLLAVPPFTPASASGPATLAFAEDTDNGTNKVTLAAPSSVAADVTVTMPGTADTLVGRATTDTLTIKSLTTPTINQGNLVGTTTNDSAAAGSVGEYVESIVLTGAATSLTTATAKTVTSISLTAGDWDVSGFIGFNTGGTTTTTVIAGGISTTNNTLPSPNDTSCFQLQCSFATNAFNQQPCGMKRISIASTTTVYLVATSTFATSTCAARGTIRARRVR